MSLLLFGSLEEKLFSVGVNYKETRSGNPTRGGNGAGDHKASLGFIRHGAVRHGELDSALTGVRWGLAAFLTNANITEVDLTAFRLKGNISRLFEFMLGHGRKLYAVEVILDLDVL